MGKGKRVEAVRGFFGGGVSSEMQGSHQEQSGISFCHAERIEEDLHQINWRTVIEVAKILPTDATVTQAECTAAVEAAKATCCLARKGCISSDLDGNLIEEYNKTRQGKGTKWKNTFEGR